MDHTYYQIIDDNIARVAEGLRVIEEYVRFVATEKSFTEELAKIRSQVNRSEEHLTEQLLSRDNTRDMRAAEKPTQRKNIIELLKANFKRVEEGLRALEEYTGNALYNQLRYRMYELEKEIILTAMKKQLQPGVYLISENPEILEQGLKWKVSCIQLRDKQSDKSTILNKAKSLQQKAKAAGIPFIINDYLDIAILCDADGLHTGQDDLDIKSIRKLLGPHKIIGRSTHTLNEGLTAQREGADYVGIGPVWTTPTKPERDAIGLEYLKQAGKKLSIPYVAIGGISLEKMQEIAPLQPPLIAVVRAYNDIPKIIKKYKFT
jgi:thiamine-phosphate pyrophosphorylase